MKENSDAQVALFSESFGKVVRDMSESLDAYRRENAALRELLLEGGLKQKQIQREVRKRLKRYRIYEDAAELSHKVNQKTLDFLRANDPLEKVAEMLGAAKRRDAN